MNLGRSVIFRQKTSKYLRCQSPNKKILSEAALVLLNRNSLKALYRGNYLYYTLTVEVVNDLRDNFNSETLTIV